jgi:hypothetical protein
MRISPASGERMPKMHWATSLRPASDGSGKEASEDE